MQIDRRINFTSPCFRRSIFTAVLFFRTAERRRYPMVEFAGRCRDKHVVIPPIGTRKPSRPPSEKRVVAHNPQRPTKNDNDHEDGIDGTIPLLFAKMVEPHHYMQHPP